MSRPDYIPQWWVIRDGRYSAARWMTRSPRNALLYWLATAVLGIGIVAWRLLAGASLDRFFSDGKGLVITAVAVVLIGMAATYGPRAYRATHAADD